MRKLRMDKGFTQHTVAEHLNVTANAISSYESDDTIPSLGNFVELMKLYDASADALLGLNCEKSPAMDDDENYFLHEMVSKLRKIIKG